jgi:pyruvate dehydrogenase E2 component (dihydrolipoamide acetyltransferase)
MAIPVEAPKLGNTVEECLVSQWLKHKGDSVSAGETVLEIETDKTTFEVAAPAAGTLLETFFPEGALVPVFTNLFVVGEPGEDAEQFRPGGAQSPPSAAGVPMAPSSPAPAPTPSGETTEAAAAGGSRTRGAVPVQEDHPTGSFTPRARRFAEEHDFHPEPVVGSGPGGRVLEEDLRKLFHSAQSEPGAPFAPLSGIREKIARRMRESLASTAQYTLHASADARGLLALRRRAKEKSADVTIGDLAAFCAIRALAEFPALNAALVDGRLYPHEEIHLGFACDTPKGLLVPVVRNAGKLTLSELAAQMRALAAQAVLGGISPDSLSGATFTVSNLGAFGIESFTPLLNPPQVAILGIDAIEVKPVRRDGGIEFIDSIGLSLTCDHQAIDGAPGARFLAALRAKIENVERLCSI